MLSVFLTCASLSLESNCVGHSEVLAERGERGEEEYEKEEKDHSPRTSGQPVLSPACIIIRTSSGSRWVCHCQIYICAPTEIITCFRFALWFEPLGVGCKINRAIVYIGLVMDHRRKLITRLYTYPENAKHFIQKAGPKDIQHNDRPTMRTTRPRKVCIDVRVSRLLRTDYLTCES